VPGHSARGIAQVGKRLPEHGYWTQITIVADAHTERVAGEQVGVGDRAVRLDETGLPARYYIPRDDVRTDLLRPSAHRTTCPFKGEASSWSVQLGENVNENLVWSYETPIPEAAGITGLLCFYNDRVEMTVGAAGQPSSSAR
jgi:uncharacterized protein (DUF427 family)